MDIPPMPTNARDAFDPRPFIVPVLKQFDEVKPAPPVKYEKHSLAFIARVYGLDERNVRWLLRRKGIDPAGDVWEQAEDTPASFQDLSWCMRIERGRRRLAAIRGWLIIGSVLALGAIAFLLTMAFM